MTSVKVLLTGIGLSITFAIVAPIFGLSFDSSFAALMGGINLSIVAMVILAVGPRFSLFESFAIFMIINVELGMLMLFIKSDGALAAVVFLASFPFSLYGTTLAIGIAGWISSRK